MAALAGTPIYNLYLRLLGAKIGRDTVIAGRLIPVCTDLLSIGDNTIIRKDSIVLGYKAQSNYIHTGSITIGNNAFVGEASVLDIDTVMGNDTQLGHASSLQSGQRVPDGKHYHGSPAQETTADYCLVEAKRCSSLRRWLYPAIPLTAGLAIFAPAAIMILNYWYPFVVRYIGGTELDYGVMGAVLLPLALVVSLVLLVGALAIGLVGVAVVPRLFNKLLQPEKTYVLYGFHYWVHGIVSGASNSRIYNLLFGDSSAIVHYLTLDRLEPEQDRADRLELRHQPEARQPVPVRDRQQHDGVGRAVDDERADVEHVVQARQGEDRRPQLSRQQHPLPARRRRPAPTACSAPR